MALDTTQYGSLLGRPSVLNMLSFAASFWPDILRHNLASAGKAVLVSSHILAEMEEFCNSVGIVEQGRLMASGLIAELRTQTKSGRSMRVVLATPDGRLASFLERDERISELTVEDESAASFSLDGGLSDAAELLRTLVESGFPLADFTEREGSLQEMFLEISSGATS